MDSFEHRYIVLNKFNRKIIKNNCKSLDKQIFITCLKIIKNELQKNGNVLKLKFHLVCAKVFY